MKIIEVDTSSAQPEGTGVLLMALGHSLYGKLAVNLALGLKYKNPALRIALIHDTAGIADLSLAQKFLFDIKIMCPLEYALLNGSSCYVKPKLYLNKLTPFETTLFMDADIVWSPYKEIQSVFSELSGVDFTMANRGKKDGSGASDWVDMNIMRRHFQVEYWLDLSSEWIWFKKTPAVDALFATAAEIYHDDKLVCKAFAGGKPDEPAFALAMMQTGVFPHTMPYYPTYWEPVMGYKKAQDIMNQYYGISLGGKFVDPRISTHADKLVHHYQYHMKIEGFKNVNKYRFIKERANI